MGRNEGGFWGGWEESRLAVCRQVYCDSCYTLYKRVDPRFRVRPRDTGILSRVFREGTLPRLLFFARPFALRLGSVRFSFSYPKSVLCLLACLARCTKREFLFSSLFSPGPKGHPSVYCVYGWYLSKGTYTVAFTPKKCAQHPVRRR